MVSGPACFFAARWVRVVGFGRYRRLCSGRATAILTAGFIFVVVGVVPGQQLFHDQMLARIDPILPFTPGLKHSFRQMSDRFITPLEMSPTITTHAGLVQVVHAKPPTSHKLFPPWAFLLVLRQVRSRIPSNPRSQNSRPAAGVLATIRLQDHILDIG